MFIYRLKCSLKLVGTITVDSLPWCILAGAISLIARYFIRGDASVFNSLFRGEAYLYLFIVIITMLTLISFIFALSKMEIPDTNMAGYRQFIKDKFRS